MKKALLCVGLGLAASVTTLAGTASADRGTDKVEICHLDDDTDTYKLLSLSAPAAARHVAHGDGSPGGAVPGMDGHIFDESTCAVVTAPPDPTPNVVDVSSSSAAGSYEASGATFGPAPTEAGVVGSMVPVNDGSGLPTDGCGPLIGFPAGAIALIDRGTCPYVDKVLNAQAVGAVAVIIVNNEPGAPVTLDGASVSVAIPAVMVSQADGAVINAGLPASGTVRADT